MNVISSPFRGGNSVVIETFKELIFCSRVNSGWHNTSTAVKCCDGLISSPVAFAFAFAAEDRCGKLDSPIPLPNPPEGPEDPIMGCTSVSFWSPSPSSSAALAFWSVFASSAIFSSTVVIFKCAFPSALSLSWTISSMVRFKYKSIFFLMSVLLGVSLGYTKSIPEQVPLIPKAEEMAFLRNMVIVVLSSALRVWVCTRYWKESTN